MRNVLGQGFENDAGHEFENKFGSGISEKVMETGNAGIPNKGMIEDYITKGG